jgi:threonine/homoserine/homoserine lactone efflux protein
MIADAGNIATAVGALLAPAMGIALSPFPIIAVILVLGTPKARVSGPAFAAGWLVGIGALTTLVTVLFNDADTDTTTRDIVSWLRIAAGVALIALAAKKWRGRPGPGEDVEMPGWMASIDTITPGRAVVLGAGLGGVNPKNIAFAIAAAGSIGEAAAHGGDAVVSVIVFVVLASSTVLASVLVHAIGGSRAAAPLDAVKRFMVTHNHVIMMLVFLLLGAKILGDGVAGLDL